MLVERFSEVFEISDKNALKFFKAWSRGEGPYLLEFGAKSLGVIIYDVTDLTEDHAACIVVDLGG